MKENMAHCFGFEPDMFFRGDIVLPYQDEEEEDGDDVQYIKEEKAPPITIDETEDQDDVIFVATCPAPPPTLPPPWDDALALDIDDYHLPTPTSSCSSDVPTMAGGSSLSNQFCSLSAILDSSTPPSLPSATTNPLLASDLNADTKMSLSVLGTDLTLGTGGDLTASDPSPTLSTLSGALTLSSMTSDLAGALSDSSLTLPSVSGTLSGGLPGGCAGGLTGSKAALGTNSSLFSIGKVPRPLDLSRHDKVHRKMPLRKKKTARRPQYSVPGLSDLDVSSSSSSNSDNPSDSDLEGFPSSDQDDPMDNSDGDESEKSDDPGDDPGNDDDDSSIPNYTNLLGLTLASSQNGLLGNSSGGLLSNSSSGPSQPSSSSLAPCSKFQSVVADVFNSMSQALSANSPLMMPTSATNPPLGAPSPSSSATQSSFNNPAHTPAPTSVPAQPVTAAAAATIVGGPSPSTSSLVLGLGCSDSTFADTGCQQLSVNSQLSVNPQLSVNQNQNQNQQSVNQLSVNQVSVTVSVNLQQQLAASSASPQVSVSSWSGSGATTSIQSSSSDHLLFQPTAGVSGAPVVKQQTAGSSQAAAVSGVSSGQNANSDFFDKLYNECKVFLSGLPSTTTSTVTTSPSSSTVLPACVAGSSAITTVCSSSQSLTAPSSSSHLVSVTSSFSSQLMTAVSSSSQDATAVFSPASSFTTTCSSSSVTAACSSVQSGTAACSSSQSLLAGCSSSPSVSTTASSVDADPLNSFLMAMWNSSDSSAGIDTNSGAGNNSSNSVGSSGSVEKGVKRQSTTSLSSLDVASLPPRKRVLKHSISSPSSIAQPPPPPASLLSGSSVANADDPPSGAVQQQVALPGPSNSSGQDVGASGSGVTSGQDMAASGSGVTTSACGSGVVSDPETCKSCGKEEGEITGEREEECKISHCPLQHPACGDCLMVQARRILTGKQKETLKCLDATCNSFYHINELKKSLPSLIVDILQERADQDMVAEVMDIIDQQQQTQTDDKHNTNTNNATPSKPTKSSLRKKTPQYKRMQYTSSSSDADDEDDDDYDDGGNDNDDYGGLMSDVDGGCDGSRNSRRRDSSSEDQGQNDFPEHWSRMDNSKNLVEVVVVPLEPNSDEYINVAVRFHEHMHFPAADITRIVRVQNPYLWKSYALKKEQMIQENGGRVVNEYQLFHGTKVSAIDAICRRGFDWRFCGKNGTAFGQGCYFAGDSLYSNAYTDRGSPPSQGSTLLKSIMPLPPAPSTDPASSSSSSTFPPSDPSLTSPAVNTQQQLSQLHALARFGPSGSGSGSGSGKTNFNMKKLLQPLLKGKTRDSNCLAQLLKAKTNKLCANIVANYAASTAPRPSSGSGGSRTVSGNLMYGPAAGSAPLPPPHPAIGPMFGSSQPSGSGPHPAPAPSGPPPPSASHHPRSAPSRHQQGPSQSSAPPHRQALYAHHQRYSLLVNPPRSHPSAPPPSQSFPPGHSTPQSMHGAATPGQPPSGFGGLGKAGAYHTASKKYVGRSGFSPGKITSLMVRSSSAAQQVAPPPPAQPLSSQGSGGVMVPVGGYPTNLSVSSSAVTLTGGGGAVNLSGGGAPSLTLLTANTGLQPSSYLLVQPVLNPAPAPLPPLAPLAPHPLLSQPGPPPLPPPPPAPKVGSSSWSGVNQALDLRKSGSCPRYMFLAKVLTGMATGGQADYRRPPPLDPHDALGPCYDSCVDHIHTPRIWVIFDGTQAYPEYVIEYVVNGDVYR